MQKKKKKIEGTSSPFPTITKLGAMQSSRFNKVLKIVLWKVQSIPSRNEIYVTCSKPRRVLFLFLVLSNSVSPCNIACSISHLHFKMISFLDPPPPPPLRTKDWAVPMISNPSTGLPCMINIFREESELVR